MRAFQIADEPHVFTWGSFFLATEGRDRDIFLPTFILSV